MLTNNNTPKNTSRRNFLFQSSLATLGVLTTTPSVFWAFSPNFWAAKPNSKIKGVQIGVITYSFRSMPSTAENVLEYCIDSGISGIELMGDAAENYAGKPVNPVKMPPFVPGQPPKFTDEEKAQMAVYQKQVGEWRASVSMDKFVELRKMYKKAGVTIYAFKPNALNANNNDAEVEYAMKATKALGANSVTVELPRDAAQSKRLGDIAAKHKVYVGYHAHLQATDTAWDEALKQSPYNSLNLDCGHYIAAGGKNTKETLLALIEAKHDRITSLHIKDRKSKENGGANQVWGQGNTPIKEILTLLRDKKYKIPATIELEYDIPAGSDAVKETKVCLEYAKKLLG
jgi:sugar phosphate isomerase/epimerase